MQKLLASLSLLALGACAIPGRDAAPTDPGPRAMGWSSVGEGTLYARDGTPVSTRAQGLPQTTTPQPGPSPQRSVEPPGESRTYLLELYQVAIEDKERLALEVDALESSLSDSRETNRALGEERNKWIAEREALVTEKTRLEAQNYELAERLTTAQIRRLEAEGMLLEAALERTRAAAAQAEERANDRSAKATTRPSGAKPSWAPRPGDGR